MSDYLDDLIRFGGEHKHLWTVDYIKQFNGMHLRGFSYDEIVEKLERNRRTRIHWKAFDEARHDEDHCLLSITDRDRFRHTSDDVMLAYYKMRFLGQSHNMAEMLATRSFPGIRGTDSTFMQGTHMQDGLLDGVRQRMAAQAGVDTNGRRYISGLARFPGDPEAWVSGLSDVKRICTDRGWNCHGAFEHEAPEPLFSPAPDVPIAEDIVYQHVSNELAAYDPRELTPQLADDTKERLTNLLSGKVDAGQDLKVTDYGYEYSVAISESD